MSAHRQLLNLRIFIILICLGHAGEGGLARSASALNKKTGQQVWKATGCTLHPPHLQRNGESDPGSGSSNTAHRAHGNGGHLGHATVIENPRDRGWPSRTIGPRAVCQRSDHGIFEVARMNVSTKSAEGAVGCAGEACTARPATVRMTHLRCHTPQDPSAYERNEADDQPQRMQQKNNRMSGRAQLALIAYGSKA